MPSSSIRRIKAGALDVAYEEYGSPDGEPVLLMHGFPYDPRCFDRMASLLAVEGYRIIVPYLRGYGQTRFLSPQTMRSGQQAALAQDLIDLLDALAIPRAALMGFDWGGRAACIVAALWPERVRCLVSAGGYNIQNIAQLAGPLPAEVEYRLWYQTYFNTERGRDGLEVNRVEFCKQLWRLWSPSWRFDDGIYMQSARSFDNPDFVNVVIHSYRHRCANAPGDSSLEHIERGLAAQPPIKVPTISLCGVDDGVAPPPATDRDAAHFATAYERRILHGVGHNVPQEAPEATVAALLELIRTCI
jgi:pimeloyl-ACP methyl ester carboxylesterase